MLRASLVVLLVLTTTAAAGPTAAPPPPPKPPTTVPKPASPAVPPPPPLAPPKLPDRAALEKLLAETDTIAATVSSVRGLALKKALARGIMSRPEIEARVKLRLEEEYKPNEMANEERALKRLGMLPQELSYKDAVLRLLKDQIAGFYDPKAKQLYLADWIEASYQRMVMAHEIAHVLQDQHFDLQKYAPTNKQNADEQLARQAVVEGDGIAVMIEVMAREGGAAGDPWASPDQARALVKMMEAGDDGALSTAPLLLKESLVFPYAAGLRLIAELRRTLPWARLNELYKRPPRSTEQVIHPEKWVHPEAPVPVLPLKAPAQMRVLYTNVMGELLTSVFLRQHGVGEVRAKTAAAGWGGDRLQVFAPAGLGDAAIEDLTVVWRSSWDTEADAVEALETFGEALGVLVGDCATQGERGTRCAEKGGRRTVLERRRQKIVLVIGAPEKTADKLVAAAWASFGGIKPGPDREPAPAILR